MTARTLFLIVLIFWFSSTSNAQPFTAMDSIRGGYGPERSCYDLTHYHLRLSVNPQTRFLSGFNRLSGRALFPFKTLQVDLAEGFDIEKMLTANGSAKWKRKGNALFVTLPKTLEKGEKFWLQIHYQGHPHVAENAPWQGGFVWQTDTEGFPWIGLACEGEGSSLWFPSKDHPLDEPDSAFLQFEVPKNLTAVSNGRLLRKEATSDSTHQFAYRVSYPINHYNITLNVAAYQQWKDTLKLPDGQVLDMGFYALPTDLVKAKVQYAQSKKVLTTLSQLFGSYPFVRDGYNLVQTPYLGMEHQSCIAYGDKFKDNSFGFDFIVMHETGHEWWGNWVSGSDHADMWIHESFCTYSEALFLERTQNKDIAIKYLLKQKEKIKNKTAILGQREVYYNGWKDSDMYYKGSWMLHSIRSMLNDDKLWFDFLRKAGEEIGLKPINSSDIIQLISKDLKRDLTPIFVAYLQSKEWPEVEWKISQTDGKPIIEYRWNVVNTEQKLGVECILDGKNIRLIPDLDWKTISVNSGKSLLESNERLNLVRTKKVNP